MKIINNSAVEFLSSFCPSFYEKKKKKTRKTIVCACLYYPGFEKCALSEDNARETRCTGKFRPSRVILITRGRRKQVGFLQKRNPKRGAATII